jgi:hypothetical protein
MPDIFVADTNKETAANSSPQPEKVAEEKAVDNTKLTPAAEQAEIRDNSGVVHLFTSYSENPSDITFENQENDETVLLFTRKDLITNLPWIATGLALIIIPILAMPLFTLLHLEIINLPKNYSLILTIFYYLVVATFLFINFITWYFNINIVTEKRIVDIELEGIVYKNVSATKLTLVQDVSYAQVGVIRTVFDYGDVLVQTAGTLDNFIFQAIPKPEDAVHIVENLIGKRNEQQL